MMTTNKTSCVQGPVRCSQKEKKLAFQCHNRSEDEEQVNEIKV
jgi:hypothetical protein